MFPESFCVVGTWIDAVSIVQVIKIGYTATTRGPESIGDLLSGVQISLTPGCHLCQHTWCNVTTSLPSLLQAQTPCCSDTPFFAGHHRHARAQYTPFFASRHKVDSRLPACARAAAALAAACARSARASRDGSSRRSAVSRSPAFWLPRTCAPGRSITST